MKPVKITTRATEKMSTEIKDLTQHEARFGAYWHEKAKDRHRKRIADLTSQRRNAGHAMSEAVQAALNAINGRAEAHAITLHSEVVAVCERVEEHLAERGVAISRMTGVEAVYRPAGPSAGAYKYRAKTTLIRIRRVADGWRLIGVESSEVHPKQGERFEIHVPQSTRDAILAHAFFGITVDAVPA